MIRRALQNLTLQPHIVALVLLSMFMGSCAMLDRMAFENKYGTTEPRERATDALQDGVVDYWSDVKPVVESRCVVCHACYDAPCQLKMTSIEGIERGASSVNLYNLSRLTAVEPSRLHEDAQTVKQWRERGFYPVLDEYGTNDESHRQASLIYRMLELKKQHPLPSGSVLPDSFDLSLNRDQQCSKVYEFDRYAQQYPLWGMPYALPGLSESEYQVVTRWVEQGSPYLRRPELDPRYRGRIAQWETFLNVDSLKQQLASRYIYEHLFLGHIFFDELTKNNRSAEIKYFKLVRSSTPPGQPINLISTRRPYDDPGVDRVYYRIQEELETIVAKTHMPYALNPERMQFWQELFLDAEYEVAALPDYTLSSASNPFLTFNDLPVKSRHKFLLDEAMFSISGFIKGPVCRGQVALSVISDHFWVFFTNPDYAGPNFDKEFFESQSDNLALPAGLGDIYRPLTHWNSFSKKESAFLEARIEFSEKHQDSGFAIDLDMIWDGGEENDNAALTVFRHVDSGTVKKGLLGPPPKTSLFINYHLLERIHYLLVAGYDVHGNLGHQLISRTYMDFLRMTGESAFLFLLPEDARDRELAYWYREADEKVLAYMDVERLQGKLPNRINYKTNNQKLELYQMLSNKLSPVLSTKHSINSVEDAEIRTELSRLWDYKGDTIAQMPQTSYLRVKDSTGDAYFTLLKHNAHINQTSLLREQKNRLPEEDTMSAHPGFLGTYPNIHFEVNKKQLSEFVSGLGRLSDPQAYTAFVDRFGIRRTHPDFWKYSDEEHKAFKNIDPVSYGLLDYNRLENR